MVVDNDPRARMPLGVVGGGSRKRMGRVLGAGPVCPAFILL